MSIEKKELTKMSLREAELFFEKGGTFEDFKKGNTAYSESDVNALKEAAEALSKARKFITEVSSKEKFITDTFRIGFVGKSISDQFGTEYIQTSRGRPYGTLAAVYDEETGKIYAGFTYLSDDEKFPHSVIGQAIALDRALENRRNGIDIESIDGQPWLKASDKLQWKHFKQRTYRYFKPEKFSFSRGSEPIMVQNFDDVHIWQYLILAQKSKNKADVKKFLKKIEEILTKNK